ncbi:MAG: serine/threonine-protein kinase [Thermoanaerobaculales bacterium]|nr:serine/threonine-protein kinase [Thermoanaerobaculales bacterium]
MSRHESDRFGEVRALFDELAELGPTARADRLAEIARSDAALAAEVEGLLAIDASPSPLLDVPVAVAAPDLVADWLEAAPGPAISGQRVGPWSLTSLLGRGGMGEVWEAVRADGQYRHTVALKLLKRGVDSVEIRRRFIRERQILAGLTHPGIARLLDGGIAGDGRPYFVLEKVDGRPITEHARAAGLAVEDRIQLMVAACEAVDSAHRQLVVHRDLKPSNIMVTENGEIKLLDFGIAKLLGEGEDDGEATAIDLRPLTPAYAAPEQILGEPVTTATDVYSLGVVLHELLTGTLPHRRPIGSASALAAAVERETGVRLTAAARRLDAAALERLGLPPRLARRLPRRLTGDLETIVARALERQPERRYTSARALADDLVRHLEGRPVRARRQSRWYRAGRFVGRHRLGVALAAVAVLSLVGGLYGALWQADRAAAAARASAASQRRAEHTKQFLISLFEVADPLQSGGASITARDLLEQGSRRLESELVTEPELRADLLEAVARIETGLGALDEAERSARLALELRGEAAPAARATAEATLGAIRIQQGDLDGAQELLEGSLAALEAARAEPLVTARVRSDLGQVLFWRKQSAAAEALERAVYEVFVRELGAEHIESALHLRNLGVLLDDLGRLDEAETAYRESQRLLERSLGPDHPNLALSYLSLAVLLDRRGQTDEAETLYRRSLEIRRRSLGDHHVQTGQALQLLAHFFVSHGRLDEAETAGREALAIFTAVDPDHFEVGKCLNGLGVVAAKRGDHATAESLYREALANYERSLGRRHPFYWWTAGSLSTAIAAQGRLDEAETLQREVLAALEEISGVESADAQWGHELLAETLRRAGRTAEADAASARAEAIAGVLAAD